MNSRIQGQMFVSQNLLPKKFDCDKTSPTSKSVNSQVSFQGAEKLKKNSYHNLKRLSGEMKEITEFTNAVIAAVGTGIIAPLIILCSPGKGDKEDKDKKLFQAIRQPLSAGLALGFQVPATYLINLSLDKLAYTSENKYVRKMFDDKVLGNLIPDKKYIKKQITKEDISAIEDEFNKPNSKLRTKLENQIKSDYEEVGLEISEEKLEKRVQKQKKSFLKKEIVDRKFEQKIQEKCTELASKNLDIKSEDLITDDIKNLMENNHKEALTQMEKDAKLSNLDKGLNLFGYETKRVKDLKKKQDAFKIEKGIEYLQTEETGILKKPALKLRKFVESINVNAQKGYADKKFGISLFVNLFMVAASCYALNWSHPRVGKLYDKYITNKKNKEPENNGEKVEVKS